MDFIPCKLTLGLEALTNEEYIRRVNSNLDIILDHHLSTTGMAQADVVVAKAIELANELDRQLAAKCGSQKEQLLLEWRELSKRSLLKGEISQQNQENEPLSNAT